MKKHQLLVVDDVLFNTFHATWLATKIGAARYQVFFFPNRNRSRTFKLADLKGSDKQEDSGYGFKMVQS